MSMCVHVHPCTHSYHIYRVPRGNDTPTAVDAPQAQSMASEGQPHVKKQRSLAKWLIPGLRD